MAFLRRGLVTNRGEIPSIHNRRATFKVVSLVEQPENDDAQPVLHIRAVKRIIKLGDTSKDLNIVELICGHVAHTRSTYQGYCKKCQ